MIHYSKPPNRIKSYIKAIEENKIDEYHNNRRRKKVKDGNR
jgi:hypothetical protein